VTEEAFLRGILAAPGDEALRLVYADWLEERGDPRAAPLRMTWDFPRIRFIDWAEGHFGSADFYLARYPEVRKEAEEREGHRGAESAFEALRGVADKSWLAFMGSLGRPFRPFLFFANSAPRAFEGPELPLTETIGTRGSVVTLASSFRDEKAWCPGLVDDLRFLRGLPRANCFSGAAACPLHPFLCEVEKGGKRLPGIKLLRSLKVRAFRCEHISSLLTSKIPYPGYNPGTANDWIHTDADESHLFPGPGDEHDAPNCDAVHTALRAHVAGPLWYCLFHSWADIDESEYDDVEDMEADRRESRWVVLFAVGKSKDGKRLVGVVTQQVCHNLCD
jgi:uncharacterized protein (TIGR02996 family)